MFVYGVWWVVGLLVFGVVVLCGLVFFVWEDVLCFGGVVVFWFGGVVVVVFFVRCWRGCGFGWVLGFFVFFFVCKPPPPTQKNHPQPPTPPHHPTKPPPHTPPRSATPQLPNNQKKL